MMEKRAGRRHGQLIKTESGKWVRLGGPGKVVTTSDLKRRHNISDSFVKVPKLDTVNVRRMDGTSGIMLRNYPGAGFVERVELSSKSPQVAPAPAPAAPARPSEHVEVSIPQQIQNEWQMFQSQYRYEQLQARLKEHRLGDARKSCAVDHPYACPDAQELRSRLMTVRLQITST